MPDSWEEEAGTRVIFHSVASAWRLPLSPASSGEMMLAWLFPST